MTSETSNSTNCSYLPRIARGIIFVRAIIVYEAMA